MGSTGFKGYIDYDEGWACYTDHRPSICAWKLEEGVINHRKYKAKLSKRAIRTSVIKGLKEEEREELVKSLSANIRVARGSSELASERIDQSLRAIYETCTTEGRAKSAGAYDGWSPTAQCVTVTLKMLYRIRSGLRRQTGSGQGKRKHNHWSNRDQTVRGLGNCLEKWIKTIDRYQWEEGIRGEVLGMSGITPDMLRNVEPSENDELGHRVLGELVERGIKGIKRYTHGRQRTIFRKKMSIHVARMEELRKRRKLGNIIEKVLGKRRPPMDTTTVTTMEGELIRDPGEAHNTINREFTKWFKNPNMCTNQVERFLTDKDHYDECVDKESSSVGSKETGRREAKEAVWKAMHKWENSEKMDTVRGILAEELKSPPTFEQFLGALKSKSPDSAAGMSGVTYGMLQLIKEYDLNSIHDDLCRCWITGVYPESFYWRWLHMIPKVDNPTIEQVRPLMLVEAIRKIWMGIPVNMISEVLQKHQILCTNQCAYMRNKGGEAALLQCLNLAEQVAETNQPAYITSWDLRRAFDMVDKDFLIFCWTRIGVPKEIAERFISFDREGTCVIKTDLAQEVMAKEGYAGFSKEGAPETFKGEYGTGQGDVPSPLNWNCFFDILLSALEYTKLDDVDRLWYETEPGRWEEVKDTAFADDLLINSATAKGMQKKSDTASMFCVAFGMQMVPSKFRAFALHKTDRRKESIDIHFGTEWRTHNVPLLDQGVIKYLGVSLDIETLQCGRQLDEMRKTCEEVCKLVSQKVCPPDMITESIILSTYAAIKYKACYGGYTLEELRTLDGPFTHLFKRLFKLLPSFPTRLLYADTKKLGGMGLPRLSEIICNGIWSMCQREMYADDDTANAMMGIMHRANRRSAIKSLRGFSGPLMMLKYRSVITPIVSWMEENSLYLFGPGEMRLATDDGRVHLNAPIYSSLVGLGIMEEVKVIEESLGLYSVLDIIPVVGGGRRWDSRKAIESIGVSNQAKKTLGIVMDQCMTIQRDEGEKGMIITRGQYWSTACEQSK